MRLVIRWWWIVWRDSPVALASIVVLSVGSAALLTGFPWMWQYAIARLDGPPEGLVEVAGWMLGLAVAQWLLYMVLQGLRAVTNARLQWRARRRVFDHLTELDPAFYRRWRAGDLVTRLTDDAGEKISWFLCSGVFRAFEAALIVVCCLGAMVWLDPWLALWVASPLPLLLVAQAASQDALGRRYLAVQQSISAINDHLATTFEGIRVVQASGLEPAVRRVFSERAAVQRDAEIAVARVQQAVQLQYGYGWQVAMVALLLAGGPAVIDGRISLGVFVTFDGLVMSLVWPMFDLGNFLSRSRQAAVAIARLQALMDEPIPADRWGDGALADASIAVADADVIAEDGTPLAAALALEVAPGERVALVGEVGSGKSSAVALLAGLRQAVRGELRIGGRPRADLDRGAARAAVALVPQDPVLLSATLRDNVTLGRELTEAAIARALAVSRLDQDLDALPAGLETQVGERGVTLSGGQQQRVAIARALAGEPAILLLDDATAALDADTEAAFWDRLDALGGVTAVVVTHRVATLARADRVLVFDRGRIVQRGTHADLLGADGPYRRIYGKLEAAATVAGA